MAAAATARTAPRHSRPRSGAAQRSRGPAAHPHHAPARAPSQEAPPRAPATVALIHFVEKRTKGLLDQLLRGRLWVGCIGVLLAGIVFLNVSLLEVNQEIAHTSAKAGALDRQNAGLRMKLAGLDSADRIRRIAARRGMVFPQAGDYHYLTPGPGDGALAARRTSLPRAATTIASSAVVTSGVVTPTVRTTSPMPRSTPTQAQPTTTYRTHTAPPTTSSRTSPPTAAAPVVHP